MVALQPVNKALLEHLFQRHSSHTCLHLFAPSHHLFSALEVGALNQIKFCGVVLWFFLNSVYVTDSFKNMSPTMVVPV